VTFNYHIITQHRRYTLFLLVCEVCSRWCCPQWLPQRSRRMSKPTSGHGIQERPMHQRIPRLLLQQRLGSLHAYIVSAPAHTARQTSSKSNLSSMYMQACGLSPAGSRIASNQSTLPSRCPSQAQARLDSTILHRVQANLRHFEQVWELEGS
jgi:hypothetical protein